MSNELEMARESYAVAYVTAVCATTVLFDYCLTFGDEVRQMWPTRLSVPKVLFMVDRYVVLPMLVCVFYLRWLVVCITVTNAAVEGILLSRVIALYQDNKPVIAIASFLYAAGIITLIGLTIMDYVGEAVHIVQDFSALPGCYAASVPSIIAGYWITSTVIESTFFALVVWRLVGWSRDNVRVPEALRLMARDSTVYFALIFALLIVNLFVFEYAPPFLSSIFVTPANTAGCIGGARMLMNLRSLGETQPGTTETTDMEMARGTELRFGKNVLGARGWGRKNKVRGPGGTMTTTTTTGGWVNRTQATREEVASGPAAPNSAVVTLARDADVP
ncbi:hypothetical protein M0805_002521 [Coniferiporia weirii]|nr:hypothetical protein M0805_002521 [Coniferiporia weirii]